MTPQSGGKRTVYGIHAVVELLQRRRGEVSAVLVQDGFQQGAISSVLEQAQRAGVQVLARPKVELDRMTGGGVHQGVVALCGEYTYAILPELLPKAGPALILLLDGVTDPQNFGALLRTAYVLGAHGVVVPQDRSAPVSPAVVKAASGASELIPVARVVNLARAMGELKEAGLWLCAAASSDKAQMPWDLDMTVPLGLVLGSEGRGLRPLSRKLCDFLVEIPMEGKLHGASLNVSSAGAILLYEVMRQRRHGKVG